MILLKIYVSGLICFSKGGEDENLLKFGDFIILS